MQIVCSALRQSFDTQGRGHAITRGFDLVQGLSEGGLSVQRGGKLGRAFAAAGDLGDRLGFGGQIGVDLGQGAAELLATS